MVGERYPLPQLAMSTVKDLHSVGIARVIVGWLVAIDHPDSGKRYV
jgi:hypothetical protein